MKKFAVCAALIALVATSAFAGRWHNPLDDAQVRVIHASPTTGAVDVLAGGGPLFEGATFKGVTPYATVPANVYPVEVIDIASGGVGIAADLNLLFGTITTVIAVNADDSATSGLEPIVLADTPRFTPFRETRVRFVHASPDAPAVSIKIKDGPFLFQGVEYKGTTDYVSVPRGVYDVEVYLTDSGDLFKTFEGVYFPGGRNATALAVDFAANLDLLLAVDRRGTSIFGESADVDADVEATQLDSQDAAKQLAVGR